MTETTWTIDPTLDKTRLDHAVLEHYPELSRSQIQHWIKKGLVTVNNAVITKPKHPVRTDDHLSFEPPEAHQDIWQGEEGPLDIIFEDEHCLVLNKPTNLTMHPGAGQSGQTLINYVLGYLPASKALPRGGMIHRLDKHTTGLCVMAKTLEAYRSLTAQMQERSIERCYEAILLGTIHFPETIDQPIGRHAQHRTQMAINPEGRHAVTHLTPIEVFDVHTHVKLKLETGRTHQIRVHCTHIQHPVLGDPQYGQQNIAMPNLSPSTKQLIKDMPRQCLHAIELSFIHPTEDRRVTCRAPYPEDFKKLLMELKKDYEKARP